MSDSLEKAIKQTDILREILSLFRGMSEDLARTHHLQHKLTTQLDGITLRLDRLLSTVQPTLGDRFTQVYHDNLWQDPESVSGPGSRKDSPSVRAAIEALTIAKEMVGFVSINDIPCGDFNWIFAFLESAPDVHYRGFDVVPALIDRNRTMHAGYQFDPIDITIVIPPRADLIFSKDFFNHLMNEDVKKALVNMKRSGAAYLLTSNNFGFANAELHANTGNSSRYLDLCGAPFCLPRPIWETDYMGLWRLSDIPW